MAFSSRIGSGNFSVSQFQQHGSVLSDKDILEFLKTGDISIYPYSDLNLQPASYDLTLGTTFYRLKKKQPNDNTVVDIKDKCSILSVWEEIELRTEDEIKNQGFVIYPKEFVLATTVEEVYISPKVSAFISGRSSIGRLGLFIENAGWVDSGFRGKITLELFNASDYPIRIYPYMRIAQIIFLLNKSESENQYRGKYQNQNNTTPSRIYKDFVESLMDSPELREFERIYNERMKRNEN